MSVYPGTVGNLMGWEGYDRGATGGGVVWRRSDQILLSH